MAERIVSHASASFIAGKGGERKNTPPPPPLLQKGNPTSIKLTWVQSESAAQRKKSLRPFLRVRGGFGVSPQEQNLFTRENSS